MQALGEEVFGRWAGVEARLPGATRAGRGWEEEGQGVAEGLGDRPRPASATGGVREGRKRAARAGGS